ncbi:MAG: DUF6445 family protein [Sphingomicrobium sp.]
MPSSPDLFATGQPVVQADHLAGEIPVLVVDGIFANPKRVRETALALPFEPAGAHYPGRKALLRNGDPSLIEFIKKIAGLVTRHYLPLLPRFPHRGRPERITGIDTDFAITDAHPSELTKEQTRGRTLIMCPSSA